MTATLMTLRPNCPRPTRRSEHGRFPDVFPSACVAGVDACLDADEHEGRDQHGVPDLFVEVSEVAVPLGGPVVGEHAGIEVREQHHDEDQDRDDLEDGHDAVDDRRVPDAPRDQVVEQPHTESRRRNRQHGGAVAEALEERADRGTHEHPVEGVTSDRTGPEPNGGVEARVVTEPGLGVDEDAGVQLRLANREILEHEPEHEHARAGDRPRDQRAQDAGRDTEPGRQGEDPRTDHAADNHRGQRRDAQLGDHASRRRCDRLFGAHAPSDHRPDLPVNPA